MPGIHLEQVPLPQPLRGVGGTAVMIYDRRLPSQERYNLPLILLTERDAGNGGEGTGTDRDFADGALSGRLRDLFEWQERWRLDGKQLGATRSQRQVCAEG